MTLVNSNPRGTGGGSSRLLAHRLANYDAEQAKAAGPHFEKQWRAHWAGRTDAAAVRPMTQPTQPATMSTAAIIPPPKPVPTAAERAVLEGQRHLRIAAQEASRKAAAARAAEQHQAEIAASWRQVHAEIRAPLSHQEQEDPRANHGWAGIHAEIRASRAHYGDAQ